MVFPPLPLYLDPPNWSQQHQIIGANHDPQHPNFPQPPHPGGDAAADAPIRAVSTAERARLAKIPMMEGPLKCPRCDSINTKFCYFNNYSLSQPRHFCKTCRRYWTRGGALRSVPVGGGCRRTNKRRKTTTSRPKTQEPVTPAVAPPPAVGLGSAPSRIHEPAQAPPFPFMVNSHLMGNLNFGDHMPFVGGFGLGLGSTPAAAVFPFLNEGVETASFGKSAAVKPELNLSSQVVDEGQFWSSNGGLIMWTGVSGMSSSSAAVDDHSRRHDHRYV